MNINVPEAATYQKAAAADLAKAKQLRSSFEKAEKETGVPKALIAG